MAGNRLYKIRSLIGILVTPGSRYPLPGLGGEGAGRNRGEPPTGKKRRRRTVNGAEEGFGMLSKHPLDLPVGRKLSKEEIIEALRLAIIAELDAINMYLQLARAIDMENVRKVFEEVAREEKTHVGEFQALLLKLDEEQVEELEKGKREVEEL